MPPPALCSEGEIAALLETASGDAANGLRATEALLRDHPDDHRLYFLKGSLLAARQDYAAARQAMRAAVDLAPDYAIAWFQSGLLALTSGEPYAALQDWGPLQMLPDGHYLRLFAKGLCHLIRDEFGAAAGALEDGIAANRENMPLNADMRLIVEEISKAESGGEAQSPVALLLRQSALKSRKH